MTEFKAQAQQKQLEIKFFKQNYGEHKGKLVQEVWADSPYEATLVLTNSPQELKLKYKDYKRRKLLNIEWEDSKNNMIYYSSMNLLHHVLTNNLIKDGYIEGTFIFKKQGTSILLDFYNSAA